MPPTPMIGKSVAQRRAQLARSRGCWPPAPARRYRPPASSACGRPCDRVARDRGVGGDHAVHAVAAQRGGDHLDLGFVEIRRDLHEQRHPPAMPLRPAARALVATAPSSASSASSLCSARRLLGVGAGDVDRHVVGMRVDAVQADQVVVDRASRSAWRRSCRCSGPAASALRSFGESARAARWPRKASSPSLLKPSRLISASAWGRRNMRGLGLPGCAFGVTVPTSTKPKPMAPRPSMQRAFLSRPGGQAHAVGERQAGQRRPDRRREAQRKRSASGVFCSARQRVAGSVRGRSRGPGRTGKAGRDRKGVGEHQGHRIILDFEPQGFSR